MDNLTRETFQGLFEKDLRLLRNSSCNNCDATIKGPLLPFRVGSHFADSTERILFVGKSHTAEQGKIPGEKLVSGIYDPTPDEDNLWDDRRRQFWTRIGEIAKILFPEPKEPREWIAISNVIKCTNSNDKDRTTGGMVKNCLDELRVIWKEICILEPLTVIFFTYSFYPDHLKNIPISELTTIKEISAIGHKFPCGKKNLGWWERSCETAWTNNLRILVTGHPERMKKEEYKMKLVNWIKPGSYPAS